MDRKNYAVVRLTISLIALTSYFVQNSLQATIIEFATISTKIWRIIFFGFTFVLRRGSYRPTAAVSET